MIRALLIAAAVSPLPTFAAEVGSNPYRYSSELVVEGAVPFATSGAGQAIYGLRKDDALYLCFIADRPTDQNVRQKVLVAEIMGEAGQKSVPNIPVLCVMTQ
ncbi:hypothetical protein SAMN05444722_1166 [Rhodovulum sp. ES.010]|uniref:hypothetical protein n=1 Tax=Rhodovulum sp. ES.010 TaxID=1882821 RepID=UPI00092C584A|nr:hypothetical protein [Rhodovulum sp. ES.010]SIO27897.1 hypothetical protein SAMN05444722_1166 [Rhodovulum sp. ES.010]